MARPASSPLLALACLALAGCVVWPDGTGPGAAPMPLAEALDRRDRGLAVIVDVRTPQEYAAGHVPGAVNIPLDQLPAHVAELRRAGKLPVLDCG